MLLMDVYSFFFFFRYDRNMKELSQRFKDEQLSPSELVVYWTEYVLRHKGAHHLRSIEADSPYYQYLLFDIIALAMIVIVIFGLSAFCSLKLSHKFSIVLYRKYFQINKIKKQ